MLQYATNSCMLVQAASSHQPTLLHDISKVRTCHSLKDEIYRKKQHSLLVKPMAAFRFGDTRASESLDYLVLRRARMRMRICMHASEPVGALRAFIGELEDRRGRDLTDRQADALVRITERLIISLGGGGQVVACKCGRSYSKPIKLTVHQKGYSETYPACPYCFSRFSESQPIDSAASDDESEVQLELATHDVLTEIEICSDTEGRFIFQCAEFYGMPE